MPNDQPLVVADDGNVPDFGTSVVSPSDMADVDDGEEVGTQVVTSSESQSPELDSAADSSQQSDRELEESEPRGPDPDAPFALGDVVVGRTLWSNDRGSKIELLDFEGIQGFLPRREYPYRLLEAGFITPKPSNLMPPGMTREYKILNIPPKVVPGKMGPLLGAREVDKKLMMERMVQLVGVVRKDREVVKAHVYSSNRGGLKVLFAGSACFIPKSQLLDDEVQDLSEEEFSDKYRNKELEATVIRVEPEVQRIVLSMRRAEQYNTLRNLKPGALVSGTVRKIFSWGVFIGIDGTYESALIHRSNMTKGRFSRVEELFELDDRVSAIVLGMEDDYSRISCSTAHLEEEPGDMVKDKQYVFDHAEEQAARIQHLFEEKDAEVYDDVEDLQEFTS